MRHKQIALKNVIAIKPNQLFAVTRAIKKGNVVKAKQMLKKLK